MAPPDLAPDARRPAQSRAARPLTVLLLSKSFSAPGGVVNFVRSILDHLPAGVRPEHLAIGRGPDRQGRLSSLLVPLRDNVRLARLARRRAYDCVHINPSMNVPSLLRDGLFLLTLRASGYANVLVHFHGWDVEQAARLARSRVGRRLFRFAFGHARAICVLATPFKDTLTDMGIAPDTVHVTTTMFNTRIFDGLSRNRDASRPRILFLSRLVKQKGVYETLEAFALLRQAGLDAELVIAGDGPELNALQRHAVTQGVETSVTFPGYLDGADKAQALLDADLFVFPTAHYEGCPVALLEAMAAGLPVITTSIGGIPDVFSDGRNGILLERVESKALAATMRRLLADPARRTAFAANNRHDAWSRYRAEAVVARLMQLYERVCARGAA